VIEASRLFARIHVGEPAKYKVERWDWNDSHVEEIVAPASLIMIGQAAFRAAVEQYPDTRLTFAAGREGDPEIARATGFKGPFGRVWQSPTSLRPKLGGLVGF
jgi:hypothetical protein